jgi:signal transduction histidine kinase
VQFVQVFQNLISNAIKYRRDEPPRVHVSAVREGRSWTFSVKDNGIGISPQYWDRIFGLFKRLHGRDIPGTGIGLATCKKIIEQHGGHIRVDSVPGEGTTFFFTLAAAD